MYNEKRAISQGWLLAKYSERRFEIQKFDDDPLGRFASDEDALAYVRAISTAGDQHAAFCLAQLQRKGEVLSTMSHTHNSPERSHAHTYADCAGEDYLPGACCNLASADAFSRVLLEQDWPLEQDRREYRRAREMARRVIDDRERYLYRLVDANREREVEIATAQQIAKQHAFVETSVAA